MEDQAKNLARLSKKQNNLLKIIGHLVQANKDPALKAKLQQIAQKWDSVIQSAEQPAPAEDDTSKVVKPYLEKIKLFKRKYFKRKKQWNDREDELKGELEKFKNHLDEGKRIWEQQIDLIKDTMEKQENMVYRAENKYQNRLYRIKKDLDNIAKLHVRGGSQQAEITDDSTPNETMTNLSENQKAVYGRINDLRLMVKDYRDREASSSEEEEGLDESSIRMASSDRDRDIQIDDLLNISNISDAESITLTQEISNMVSARNLPVGSFDKAEPSKQQELQKVQRISLKTEEEKKAPVVEELDIAEVVPQPALVSQTPVLTNEPDDAVMLAPAKKQFQHKTPPRNLKNRAMMRRPQKFNQRSEGATVKDNESEDSTDKTSDAAPKPRPSPAPAPDPSHPNVHPPNANPLRLSESARPITAPSQILPPTEPQTTNQRSMSPNRAQRFRLMRFREVRRPNMRFARKAPSPVVPAALEEFKV